MYKLNLRNKAGWRLHFAVHAYCAFYGWNYNTPFSPPCSSTPALRRKPPRAVTSTGQTVQLCRTWAGRGKGSEPWWQVVRPLRLISCVTVEGNTQTLNPVSFYYWSRNIMPSRENINMQGKIKSTGHRGSCLFLLYPWACIILQKGRHKDTSLDKLNLVIAIIYTHHNVLFSLFQTLLYIFFLTICAVTKLCKKSDIRIYNSIFKLNFLLLFHFTPIDDRTAKTQSPSHSY